MSDQITVTLSIEQQFQLKSVELQTKDWSEAKTKKSLVNLFKHMMERETLYKLKLKQAWGI